MSCIVLINFSTRSSSLLSASPPSEDRAVFNAPKVKLTIKRKNIQKNIHLRVLIIFISSSIIINIHCYMATQQGHKTEKKPVHSDIKLGSVVLVDGFRGNRRMPRSPQMVKLSAGFTSHHPPSPCRPCYLRSFISEPIRMLWLSSAANQISAC